MFVFISVGFWNKAEAQVLPSGSNPHGVFADGIECSDCHTNNAWVPLKDSLNFNHNQQTQFELIGSHIQLDCESCHLNNNFYDPILLSDISTCTNCHVDVHQGVFTSSCEQCHDQDSFTGVDGFLAHMQTNFPLLGAHAQVACESCHQSQQRGHFVLEEEECVDCHKEDYIAANTIAHQQDGSDQDCEACHSTNHWQPALFDHALASNGFELLGAHQSIPCSYCHSEATMDLIFNPSSDQDCYACHEDDYNKEHSRSGFPTTCTDCHTTSTWEDASFKDHDQWYFPIFSGEHRGEWTSCQTCHVQPENFSVFSCLTCHEHNESEMNREHDDVRGYIYSSEACLSCHPNGEEEDDD